MAEAAETRARQERERFRALSRELDVILEGVVDGITVQDRSGRLLFANSAAARQIGVASREELLTMPLTDVLKNFELLDEHGNPKGGIRTTYVDLPTFKYTIRPAALNPVVAGAAPYIAAGGQNAANLMCGLSTSQTALDATMLKRLYKTKTAYVKAVDTRLTQLEKAGWSLPLYRSMILADANSVTF